MRAACAYPERRHGLGPVRRTAADLAAFAARAVRPGHHDYEGIAVDPEAKPRLIADIDDKTFLMLRNHGLLVAGSSVQEAFLAAYTFEAACAIQIKAQSGGSELIPIARPILDGIAAQARVVLARMGRELAWPTLLRRLDRTDPSYRS